MRPSLAALALALALVACKKVETPGPTPAPATATPAPAPATAAPAPSDGGDVRAQVPLGGDGPPPQLAFKITKVYPGQAPRERGHASGGDWVFFDAETAGGARFSFGWENKKATSNRFSFGKARLEVPDKAAGAAFVDEFARAFHVKVPASGEARKGPFEFGVAILGDKLAKDPSGGYGGKGTWTATKIFPELGERQGEVFFNFSLIEKRGELSEKDAEYDEELAKIFAAALRDGGK